MRAMLSHVPRQLQLRMRSKRKTSSQTSKLGEFLIPSGLPTRYFLISYHSSTELFDVLHGLQSDPSTSQAILDVRGQGLMVAVEFASPKGTGEHDPFRRPGVPERMASRVAKRCQEKGMLILTTSVYEVIRFIPPLNITAEDLKKGAQIFVEAVEEIVREG
jgi:acetylornithine/succinyldiaminopimelate/putrescine aminotransferase